jgi:hypothetical protein
MEWDHMAGNKDQWPAILNMAINIWIPWKVYGLSERLVAVQEGVCFMKLLIPLVM